MSQGDSGTRGSKWARAQRFRLTPAGREAGRSYRQDIIASRGEPGRKPFDAAREAWAARLSLESMDGLYLVKLLEASRTIAEIAESLDGCGPKPVEVRAAIERLVRVQMIQLVVPPPPAPPLPPRRW